MTNPYVARMVAFTEGKDPIAMPIRELAVSTKLKLREDSAGTQRTIILELRDLV